jgi:hypothetical protein
VAEWPDRKQEEVDTRFYLGHQQLPEIYDAGLLKGLGVS